MTDSTSHQNENQEFENIISIDEYKKQSQNIPVVVIVSEEEVEYFSLKKKLEKKCTIHTAKDVLELSSILGATSIDYLYLHTDVIWLDGFEICATLRSQEKFKTLPIFLFSGMTNQEKILKSLDVRCNDFLQGPLTEDVILKKMENSDV